MFSVMSVCLSVCLSVQAITFEPLHVETSFLVCTYIFPISRSSLSIKVILSRARSFEKNANFTYFNMLILCMWLQVINKVKFMHQGEGHIKVKVKISTSLQILCSPYSLQVDGLHSTEMCSCFNVNFSRTLASVSFSFFFKFLLDTCSLLGPLIPLFQTSGDVSSGFQSQSGFCLI